MYDVAIYFKNVDEVPKGVLEKLEFYIIYVHDEYTDKQIIMRTIFMIISLILFLCFTT